MARERIELKHEDEPRNSTLSREDIPTRVMDIENDEEALFLRTEKRVPVRRGAIAKKTANRLKTVCILAMVAAFTGCLAWSAYLYATQAARFRVVSSDNIEVTGVANASRSQIMDVVRDDVRNKTNIFSVPLEQHQWHLEQIPWVESASVMRLLPNHISLTIRERTPVAFVQMGSKINLIDSSGVVLGLPASRQTKFSFPVIHGIAESDPLPSRAATMKLYNRMLGELDSGSGENEHYTRQISEVDLADPEDVKATVNDAGGTVLVHLGDEHFLERYKMFVTHIGEWRQQFPKVESVDLRYEGQIVVNPDTARTAQPEPAPEMKPAPKPAAKAQAKKPHRHRKRK
ncbi:MAG TPA: FtsQ-type POTRA domain-containing protein [Candidatus Angelobacter sp.]|nr:FtsQ-type POTRA domain-containing protein [Candidatus Angelobacter sp.]